MSENLTIRALLVVQAADGSEEYYSVGNNGVTEIRAAEKAGMYCYIPYIQVFKDERLIAEFCQHNVIGVYY